MKELYSGTKRIALLKTGKMLFWKHGFRRVSVDEICKEAGVSKMTFYRCFENKIELAKIIFSEMARGGVEKFYEIINSDLSASEKLRKMLLLKMDNTNDISREFIMDFYNSPDTDLQKFVTTVTRTSWDEIINGFRYSQEMGWFRKDFKPEFLFYIAQKISPMVADEELLKYYSNPQELIMEFANFFFYGISPYEDQ